MTEPALTELSASLLYMINNNHITTVGDPSIEELIDDFNNSRLKVVSKNYDLFLNWPIYQIMSGVTIPDFMANEALNGIPYGISIQWYASVEYEASSQQYEHALFLDVTRDGMRLITPIYKLFNIDDNTLFFEPIGCTTVMRIEMQPEDKFIMIKGDTIRTIVRQMKKQVQFKANAQREHAGIAGKFNADQI